MGGVSGKTAEIGLIVPFLRLKMEENELKNSYLKKMKMRE